MKPPNPDTMTPYQRRYWANPDHFRALGRIRNARYRANHPAPTKVYRGRTPEQQRRHNAEWQRRYRLAKKLKALLGK